MTANVLNFPISNPTVALICTGCGATGTGSCNCGAMYIARSERAAKAVIANPEKSDRAIAAEIGVSPSTVKRAREEPTSPSASNDADGKRIGRGGYREKRLAIEAALNVNPHASNQSIAEATGASIKHISAIRNKLGLGLRPGPGSSATRISRSMLYRRMKLGEDLVDRLKGTTLDNIKEIDELIVLNRGAPVGEHTEIVKRLVEDAMAGKKVSAVAEGAKLGPTRHKPIDLKAAWDKRMTRTWEMANRNEQTIFVEYVMSRIKGESSE